MAGTPTPAPAEEAARPIVSIRWVVSFASVLLTTLVVVGVGVVAERNARRALTEELVARLCAQANDMTLVSGSAFLTPFPELTLHPLLLQLREREPALVLATICDQSGTILGDADPRRLGRRFVSPPGLAPRPTGYPVQGVSVFESSTLLLASAPIVHPNGAHLGTTYIALGRGAIDQAVTQARQPVLLLYVGFLAFGVIGSFLLTTTLLQPIDLLRTGLDRIGRGDLDARLEINSRTEFGRLAQAVNRMAQDLKQGQAEAIERERLAHEMELAQRIQRLLLPSERIVAGGFVVVGTQRPAAEVGGDFYDVFHLPDGRIGFVIADVAGKGLGGCLVTSMLAVLLAALREASSGPANLLAMLDRCLAKRLDRGVFVTMFVGFIDPRRGVMTYASAGHHAALLVHPGGRSEWLKTPGLPIGADRRRGIQSSLVEANLTLVPGDLVVQTTDGIHETEGGPAQAAFGFEREAAVIAEAAPGGAQAVVDELSKSIQTWRGHELAADDETIVVVSWEGSQEGVGEDPLDSPLERVNEARVRGLALKLPASLDALVRIEDWLARLPGFSELPGPAQARVILVLYELCANIVEHGKADPTGQPIALWWVADRVDASGSALVADAGHFVILDQALPFSADNSAGPDFGDPQVRRRGRGFGIDLVRRASSRLVYHPSTPIGNVTLVSIRATEPDRLEGIAA